MLVFLAALAALAGLTRADCDACIDGRCHSRNTIISGLPITDQMAVDPFNNILYLQLNGNLNVAISLDHPEIRLISMMKTTGMVFDEVSRKLYLGTKEIPMTFYTYDRASNTTEANPIRNVLHPDLQDYSGHNLPLMMIKSQSARESHCTYLKNLTISGLAVEKSSENVYFVSNNSLYKHINNESIEYMIRFRFHGETRQVRKILSRNHMVLSTVDVRGPLDEIDSEVYIGDATEKVIYKLDKEMEKLNVYAAYKTGAVAEFIFGSDNQLLTRDEDGTVVQWVPTSGNDDSPFSPISREIGKTDCIADPPSPNFSIRKLDHINCPINY